MTSGKFIHTVLLAAVLSASSLAAAQEVQQPPAGEASVLSDTPKAAEEAGQEAKAIEAQAADQVREELSGNSSDEKAGDASMEKAEEALRSAEGKQEDDSSRAEAPQDASASGQNAEDQLGERIDEALRLAERQKKIDEIIAQAEVYLYGDGVPVDLQKAASLYQEAADLGSPKAKMRLSTMYRRGTGVKKDEHKAFLLAQEAAELDYAPAQAALGAFYRDGMGVQKDPVQSDRWIEKAAENGHIMAMVMSAQNLLKRKDDPQAGEKAEAYIERVRNEASPQEIYSIGYSYAHGLRLPRDTEKAMQWAQLGAEKGEVNAMYLLGECYWTQRKFAKALEWFEKAAGKGLEAAQLQTGRIYRDGAEGVRPNPQKAVQWLAKASSIASNEDIFSLMVMQKTGPRAVRNNKKAQEWLDLYLINANPDELHELSEKYWKGQGVRRNYDIGGALALGALLKGDQRYLCDFAVKLGTQNWVKADYVTAYAVLNDCLLETPDHKEYSVAFAELEELMNAKQLQSAQQLEAADAVDDYLNSHKPSIE